MKGKTIPIEIEDQIREDLRRGVKISSIVIAYEVARRTVARIKQMLDVIEGEEANFHGVNTVLYKAIVDKARKGFTQHSISFHHGVSEELIGFICRHAYAQRRTSDNRSQCPTCGNVMIKVVDEPKVRNRVIIIKAIKFLDIDFNDDAIAILSDIEALDDLGIISNQLFCNLASRATKLLDEVEEACK